MSETRLSSCSELLSKSAQGKNFSTDLRSMLEPLRAKTSKQLAADIADHIGKAPRPLAGVSGPELAGLAKRFHERAGTLTSKVKASIDKLSGENPRLLLAHQPNVLPSLNVLAPVVLLRCVGDVLAANYKIDSTVIFFLVDYDTADDARFRSAKYPDPFSRGGVLSLSGGVLKHQRRIQMSHLPKPDLTHVVRWIEQIKCSIAHVATLTKAARLLAHGEWKQRFAVVREELNLVAREMMCAYEAASTLSEFNAFFLSRVINELWDQEVCFIPGGLVHSKTGKALEWAVRNAASISRYAGEGTELLQRYGYNACFNIAPEDALLWYVCDDCLERINVRVEASNVIAEHLCPLSREHKTVAVSLDEVAALEGKLYPKVILDNLFDIIVLGKCGGTGYIGQAAHVLVSNYVAGRLSLNNPPQILCGVRWAIDGLAELGALAVSNVIGRKRLEYSRAAWISYWGRATILYYLLSCGVLGTLETWYNFYSAAADVHMENNMRATHVNPSLGLFGK